LKFKHILWVILFILITTFSIKNIAAETIDRNLPPFKQYLIAAGYHYSGISYHQALKAAVNSGLYAFESANEGKYGPWMMAVNECKSEMLEKSFGCHSFKEKFNDLFTHFLRDADNVSSNPLIYTNANILAVAAIDEYIYSINNEFSLQAAAFQFGKGMKGETCTWVGIPKASGGGCSVLSIVSDDGGDAKNPGSTNALGGNDGPGGGMGGLGGVGGATVGGHIVTMSLEQFDMSGFATCPIDAWGAMGGGAGDSPGGGLTDGLNEPDWSEFQLDDTTNQHEYNSPGDPGNAPDNGGNGGANPPAHESEAHTGSIGVGDNFKIAYFSLGIDMAAFSGAKVANDLYVGGIGGISGGLNGTVMHVGLGLSVHYMPSPHSETTLKSACGGSSKSIGSCGGGGSGKPNNGDPLEDCMDPIACIDSANFDIVPSNGEAWCLDWLTGDGGYTDPSPFPEPIPSGGGPGPGGPDPEPPFLPRNAY